MKLEEMASRAIESIKNSGTEGINNAQLADQLKVPKRRIYDVVAILKAAGLVFTKRSKNGTTLFWLDISNNQSSEKNNRIKSNKIKVSTTGYFVSVSNRGTEVIIESTSPSMTIEGI